ncbi:MAG TPA: TlpA disulfide reductase family protein [Candidatus Angelobacter sp.]|nr:TlpA disulfide reductase family protein [Candidatus Angelobacter sp.]
MPLCSFKSVATAVLMFALAAQAGEPAPKLELHDLNGRAHKLEAYRGKPVVLNFWATWCVPCATEMPLLNEMQVRYNGKIVFIAASVDDDDMKTAVQSFIRKHRGGALTVMMGASLDNLNDFRLKQVMPGTVFIDGDGNIVDRLSGALKRPDLEERLKKLAGPPGPIPAKNRPHKKSAQSASLAMIQSG